LVATYIVSNMSMRTKPNVLQHQCCSYLHDISISGISLNVLLKGEKLSL
jgi:hypothetical protein